MVSLKKFSIMKLKHLYVAIITLMCFTTLAFGQKIQLISGNLNMLKEVTKMNVKYDYSNMEVGKKQEMDFVADKKEAYNRREEGRGDIWAAEWVNDRNRRFEPRFEEEFNKYCSIKLGNYPKEKYTLI